MNKSKLIFISTAIFLSLVSQGCFRPSVSAIALNALKRGDQDTFCKINLQNAGTDSQSANNLGVCYEKGYAGTKQNKEEAIKWYTYSARRNNSKAKENLARLGASIPIPDIAVAEQKERSAAWGQALKSAAHTWQQTSQNLQQQRLNDQQLWNQRQMLWKLEQQNFKQQQMQNQLFMDSLQRSYSVPTFP